MHLYEASLKTTDPITGHPRFNRLFTMRARSAEQVSIHAKKLGLTPPAGELIVYRF